jgi:hypothetical protein
MRQIRLIGRIMLTAFAAAAILPPLTANAQEKKALPLWVDEGWRSSKYPQSQWYAGFAQDAVPNAGKLAEVQKRVEKEAQNRMAEGISVRIAATSTTQTKSSQTRSASGTNETIQKDYGQIIGATTNAEVVKSELYTYYDQSTGKIYAFAAVKKSELAAYYLSRMQTLLLAAENDFGLAKQFASAERMGSALEKIAESKKNIAESDKYRDLLTAVDHKDATTAQLMNKGAALLKEVSAFEIKLREAGTVYVTGRESIDGQSVNRLIPAFQSKLSENKCRVTDNPDDAGFIMTIDVKDCNATSSGKFQYCNACVNVDITTNSGKSEAKINFTGPKVGWTTIDKACEKAFDDAVSELWKRVQEKTEICR